MWGFTRGTGRRGRGFRQRDHLDALVHLVAVLESAFDADCSSAAREAEVVRDAGLAWYAAAQAVDTVVASLVGGHCFA